MAKFEQDPDWEQGLSGKVVGLVADIAISDEVAVELADRFGEGTHVAFIAPAVAETRLEHIAGNADDAREEAEERIDASIPRLEDAGHEADVAAVGDPDPVVAIEDLLRRAEGAVEEIVLVTRYNGSRRWAERDAFDRIRRRVPVPVTALAVDPSGEIMDTDRSDPGRDAREEATIDVESRNLPALAAREVVAMVVGAVSTMVLAGLGGYCLSQDGTATGTDAGCVIAALLAVVFFLINVPHILAITLFQSTGYRGMWSTLFSRLSLYGTPVAVIASALLVL
jgi:hypothetical protein